MFHSNKNKKIKKKDSLHFISNNILTKFFKELTKYKNDCRGWVWALLLLDEWTQAQLAQLAQYNEFIENEFKN